MKMESWWFVQGNNEVITIVLSGISAPLLLPQWRRILFWCRGSLNLWQNHYQPQAGWRAAADGGPRRVRKQIHFFVPLWDSRECCLICI